MRVVFMGTPDFAVPSLRELASRFEVVLVLTRPDAVRSRGKKLEPSPVKAAALELDIPVMEATRITPEVMDRLHEAKADIFCVAAYGCILPDEVLNMAPLGIVNVHASLLPRWRGAAPIQRAILAGDERAGISIMRIGHGVDTGAYCAQASCSVAGKTADELTAELAQLGADLLCDTLPALADETAVWTEQDESLVTHAQKISKAEMRLDPQERALVNLRRVLALIQPLRAVLLPVSPCALCAPWPRMGLLPFVPRVSLFARASVSISVARMACSRSCPLSPMASVRWTRALGRRACMVMPLPGGSSRDQAFTCASPRA